ncbi:DUF6159 family protein [Halopiger goleimassiliensis]|uniref:DUF6159 family protein n=1 Tax=Halopiger goleimassiliensis TaxID=1293048 RepID=UPI000677B315|nr:DUF6159 family protein [Halopiger goleimassiliensis]
MSVRSRLGTGFKLAGGSAAVLRNNPRLLVFPVVAGAAIVAYVTAVFGGLIVSAESISLPVLIAVLFGVYAGSMFVMSFCIAALAWAARETFAGRTPGTFDAFRAAAGHVWALACWALLSAFVGVALRALEESSNIGGMIVAMVLNMGWFALTYFVVPVIVFEDARPTSMIQESGRLVRETWGETLGSEFGVSVVTALLTLPGVLLAVGLFVVASGNAAIVAAGIGLALAGIGLLIGVTLGGVAKVALYVFAREETAPDAFDDSLFEQATDASRQS